LLANFGINYNRRLSFSRPPSSRRAAHPFREMLHGYGKMRRRPQIHLSTASVKQTLTIANNIERAFSQWANKSAYLTIMHGRMSMVNVIVREDVSRINYRNLPAWKIRQKNH